MQEASIDISHLSCRKSLVLLGMANEEAFNHTVPHFLLSLSRVTLAGGRQRGERLDSHLVLVAWADEALGLCRGMQGGGYGHKCVQDEEHLVKHGSFGFHDMGFNALGFAKIKYILNGLSLGHDVVFLDTDIVVLRDPVPYFLSRNADLLAMHEKCVIYNDTVSAVSAEAMNRRPAFNIGILYFKATAPVTRCVYHWAWDMFGQVQNRSRVWDQEIYAIITTQCASALALRWGAIDSRRFQSGCFPGCGCDFHDHDVAPERLVTPAQMLPYANDKKECGPAIWQDWVMRHFACSGSTAEKGRYMAGLMEGVLNNSTARIGRKRAA
ncbi:hypothetical protein HYH03_001408 [Edaphochlamys debaryana]|uniref:Glycosyltransferase n=1 Tax=Edaphochlamys debaryana TaxID=47281 RepID=A0A835YDK8_9CHLO|nr:hypothetical protein HYH03_001408 [Edaphochlamys debaryana]|eukprot:KAG2500641.1 hypothetical protein HYH03_001408 [Edaphochlamys debaryana]